MKVPDEIYRNIKQNECRPVNQDCKVFQAWVTFYAEFEDGAFYDCNYYASVGRKRLSIPIRLNVIDALKRRIEDDLKWDVVTIGRVDPGEKEEWESEEVYEHYRLLTEQRNKFLEKRAIYKDENMYIIPVVKVRRDVYEML